MSKQIIQSNSNIVEKVLRDKDGKLIRARFFVYENNGRIKARLLDFVYLADQILLTGNQILLSIASKAKFIFSKIFSILLSPNHYQLATVFSLGSKPRAPTI